MKSQTSNDEAREKEMFACWQRLHEITRRLDQPAREEALRTLKRIQDIQYQKEVEEAHDAIRQFKMLSALKRHADRLNTFLTQFMLKCVENDFTRALPLMQSVREYQEAWKRRKPPSDEEVQEEFERKLRETQSATT